MDEHSIETIDLELAILVRRVTSITTYKKIGDLDRSAYLLLHYISTHGPAGVKALADEFQLDISTASRQAAALEQKGYVNRVPDPLDGRAHFFKITALGAREFSENKRSRTARIEEIMNCWSEEDRESFGRLLRKYNRSATKEQAQKSD